MSSRKTKHKTSRHSMPIPSAPGKDTTLPSRSVPYHTTSSTSNNPYHTSTSTYQALTPQVLHEHEHEHEHSQLALHQNPTYLHTIRNQQTIQLEVGFNFLGVDLPDSVHSRVAQDPVGMTTLGRFEVDSTYPYQQYNSYQPVVPQQHISYHQPQYSNVAHRSEAQHHQRPPSPANIATSNMGSGPQGQGNVYYAPQQEYYYVPTTTLREATSPGNDLAAVGTQFPSHVPSGYAQTF